MPQGFPNVVCDTWILETIVVDRLWTEREQSIGPNLVAYIC